ncbi:hypothetical protein SAMN06269173_10126 [Hymenobacter mucosus]|uniref:Uncharacterized protein n=1 Tax=Hymenobacter mucosus TaxID=1411120 RepID=A0A238V526_9BACT|nr:hypothetical protein SAMN06269173_10126 [Hymenobacter mucosus]
MGTIRFPSPDRFIIQWESDSIRAEDKLDPRATTIRVTFTGSL